MILTVTAIPCDQFFTDPLGVPAFSDVRPPRGEAGVVNFRLRGIISKWLSEGIVDPLSSEAILFNPGTGGTFPILAVAGAGAHARLSATTIEEVVAALAEALIQTKAPLFALGARDFRSPNTPAKDSAESILCGLASAARRTNPDPQTIIRLHWDLDEADLLAQELKRFRHHLPECKEWKIEREPIDEQWLPT